MGLLNMSTPNKVGVDYRNQIAGFIDYARSHNIDLSSATSYDKALEEYEASRLARQNPFGPRTAAGKIYDSGPFTWFSGDIISDVTQGGSPLSQWLPTRAVTYRNETVSHLTWVAPEGWDGQDYAAYLDTIVIGECEFGPRPKWEACQYTVPFGKMTFSSQTFHAIPDFMAQQDYERSPIFRVRGPNSNLPMQNDAEFGAAITAIMTEQHANWNLMNGVYGNPLQFDGMLQVVRDNFVADHVVGTGACDWSDPIVIDGSSLVTPGDILKQIRSVIRMQLYRARKRGMGIAQNDIAVVMPSPMWAVLADEIPVGASYNAAQNLLVGGNTPQMIEAMRMMITRGGLGYGFIPVDGMDIPVLPADETGQNVNSNTQITSDILILIRRAGGMTLLEQQYLDYTQLPNSLPNRQFSLAQGGIMRYGWLEHNQSCYYYFNEMYGRVISYFQPLQARITSVTVDAFGPHIIESDTYTDAFYGNAGTPGSLGAGV